MGFAELGCRGQDEPQAPGDIKEGKSPGSAFAPFPGLPGQHATESSIPHYSGSNAFTLHASAAKLPALL